MRELTVLEVRLDAEQGSPVLILKEVDGERQLAIWMTAAGASGILGALQEADPDHPSSHELMLAVLDDPGLLREGPLAGIATLPVGVERRR